MLILSNRSILELLMPAVFVHGNPETSAIWDLLIPALDRRDVVTLSPPGFGSIPPSGFGATRLDYVDWLVAELEAIGEPVDLVGHDWGGGHVTGVALTRPDLLRSWTIDVAGIFHADYKWHDMAQEWQKPDVGEATVAGMIDSPLADLVAMLVDGGMTTDIATKVAAAFNQDMARCILALYRNAAQPVLSDLGADVAVMRQRPGLVIIAELDTYVGAAPMHREVASRAGAEVSVLKGVGHWWMIQDPVASAAVLNQFWASIKT
ncbi:MAG: pimeloyl-ACP methyl ester carboxylesterase [Candidatus Pseudothioglobus sp.]|jgi:pimeloyl-ACP methyl ester carboxylesterase